MLHEAAVAWDASMAAWGAAVKTRSERVKFLEMLQRRGWPSIDEVTRLHVEQFLADPTFKPWTRCTYYTHLRAFYGWAVEAGVVDASPMAGVRRPKPAKSKPKPLTEDEVDRVMETARGDTRAFLILASYAGLRAHEIAKIRGEDVTDETIFVSGKGGKEAYLPTHPKIWALALERPRNGFWFPAPNSRGHIGENQLSAKVGYHFRDNGIPTGSIHRCRHTYATRLLRGGANIRTVQDVMRHASLATTQVYLEVTDADRRNAIGALA